ncbi:MAG TPA: ABC transporter substrate-binding protein [Acetobacteraceae bacterium]|jgi:sn-glycerol 3-phosphate transport system substrate-binding protein|nr:ABC transporter substrate-binding protein [Acetobacteraceae bacterium]
MTKITRRRLAQFAGAALTTPAISRAAGPTDISFYFPVAVGGPITKIIDGYAADFQRDNPTIKLTPIYSGTYQDTLTKARTALKAGTGPQLAVLLSTDVFSLIDDDLIVPFDGVATSEADKAWMRSFYPAFLRNGEVDGHTWGIPFQRSTIVLYWNKAAFQEAGLDPDHAPATWFEHDTYAQHLTRRNADSVERWGVQIPATGFAYWPFQALVTEAGGTLATADGKSTDFASPACSEALSYWLDLSGRFRAHPPGVVDWATTPRDFLEQKVAMIWTTTGNLANIRANAKFPFGVAMLPAGKHRGSPTGGGNFYLFKAATQGQRAAALHFLRWLSTPERAAQWCIDTGYVATRSDAWATSAMKSYVADFSAVAVARDQLQYAVAELSTHDNQRVTQALNDALQSALLGKQSPNAALSGAQATAAKLLRPFQN